jgi:thiol:disulfide interchange protein DsbD
MGTALGYALTQPAHVALLVFTALGFGMASPYLLLSYAPRFLERLPRPGPWMDWFRQLMAFPLYATVLWLLYVFGRQTSESAMWQLAVALLVLAFGTWAWGVAQRSGSRTRVPAVLASVATAAAVVVGASAATRTRALDAGEAVAETDAFWQAWSPERVESLRGQGRSVFVNFTADWCLSCQVNERVVFASEDVRDLFRAHDVTALKADWTNEDARIADTLASFGRDGIPLYVYYPADGGTPRVLPQVPTHGSLREAFASAASVPEPETKEKKRS